MRGQSVGDTDDGLVDLSITRSACGQTVTTPRETQMFLHLRIGRSCSSRGEAAPPSLKSWVQCETLDEAGLWTFVGQATFLSPGCLSDCGNGTRGAVAVAPGPP
jgi:hypothetical protein